MGPKRVPPVDNDYDGFELTKQKGGWFIVEYLGVDASGKPGIEYIYHVPTRPDVGRLIGLLYERYDGDLDFHEEYAATFSDCEWIDRRTRVTELEQRYKEAGPAADFKYGSVLHICATCQRCVDSLIGQDSSGAKSEHRQRRPKRMQLCWEAAGAALVELAPEMADVNDSKELEKVYRRLRSEGASTYEEDGDFDDVPRPPNAKAFITYLRRWRKAHRASDTPVAPGSTPGRSVVEQARL